MKYLLYQVAVVFSLLTITFKTGNAQDFRDVLQLADAQQLPDDKGTFSVSLGFGAEGPAAQMKTIFQHEGYGRSVDGFFGPINYPVYHSVSANIEVAYEYNLTDKHAVGGRLNFSSLNEVRGSSNISFKFSSHSLIPTYTLHITDQIEFETGPALMYNRAHFSQRELSETSNYISPGLLVGFDLTSDKEKKVYGKMALQYIYSLPVTIGPYDRLNEWYDEQILPEVKVGFGRLEIKFGVGFRL